MSLNWDTSNVKDYESVCWIEAEADDPSYGITKGDTILNPVTNALIWQSLSTGIGTITEDNAPEVYARITLIEKLYGPLLRRADGPYSITPEDVFAHVGLHTNASYKDEARASFLKRHAAAYLDQEAARARKKVAVG